MKTNTGNIHEWNNTVVTKSVLAIKLTPINTNMELFGTSSWHLIRQEDCLKKNYAAQIQLRSGSMLSYDYYNQWKIQCLNLNKVKKNTILLWVWLQCTMKT